MITPANAIKLAAWLAVHQPGLFNALATRQARRKSLGFFGDDVSLTDVSFDPSSVDVSADTSSAIDASTADFTPDLADVSLDAATGSVGATESGAIDTALAPVSSPASDSSFWSSVGNAAGAVTSGVLSVAKGLVSPGALTAAGTVAAAYFNTQAKTAQLQTQQAITQAQLARVNQGLSPAPITYTRNAAGQLVPVYATSQGYVPLTSSALQSLSAPSIGGLPTWAILGGGVLLLALILTAARR